LLWEFVQNVFGDSWKLEKEEENESIYKINYSHTTIRKTDLNKNL